MMTDHPQTSLISKPALTSMEIELIFLQPTKASRQNLQKPLLLKSLRMS